MRISLCLVMKSLAFGLRRAAPGARKNAAFRVFIISAQKHQAPSRSTEIWLGDEACLLKLNCTESTRRVHSLKALKSIDIIGLI